MTIEYKVIPNSLTSPPSYTARPVPKDVLGIDDLAYYINLHNPTIPVVTAKSVVEAFREEVIFQIVAGNSLNINNFFSFVPSLPVRLDTPESPLPTDPVDIKAKPSAPLKQLIRQQATYTRLPADTKIPKVLGTEDTNTTLRNYVRNGYGFSISGSNVGFDPTDSEQGVFVTAQDGTVTQQTNLSLNNPSKLLIVPDLTPAPEAWNVEFSLSVKSRYTSGGQLRVGDYSEKLRTTVAITNGGANWIFESNFASGLNAMVTAYTGTATECQIVAIIDTSGVLKLSVGPVGGPMGDEVSVTADGDFVLTGLDQPLTVTIAQGYDNVYTIVENYNKYLREVCTLEAITP